MRPPRRGLGGSRSAWATALCVGPTLLFVVVLYIVPLLGLLSRSILSNDGSQWSMEHFARLFQSTVYVNSLWVTVKLALWTALLCVGIGYPLAYLIANAKKSFGSILILCVLVPYWTGTLVRTFAWMVLLSRNGPANAILSGLGLTEAPLQLIYNFTGVMIGMVNAFTPLAILIMSANMQSIDRRLLSAAATLGAGPGLAFWRIYFPLSLPGVFSAFVLIFISSLGMFITPSLLGSGNDVMIAQVMIQQVEQLLNWGFAGAVGVLLLVATLAMLALFAKLFGIEALTGRSTNAQPRTRMPMLQGVGMRVLTGLGLGTDALVAAWRKLFAGRSSRTAKPGASPLVWAVSVAVLLFLVAPSIFLIPVSFGGGSFIEWPPRSFSVRWYQAVLGSPEWMQAGLRSIMVALVVSILSVCMTLPVAMAMTRRPIAGRRLMFAILLAPAIVPQVLYAVSLLLVYSPLGLVGTDLGLILGHIVVCLPYTLLTLVGVLSNFDYKLMQAAETLGASSWQRLRRVLLPLISRGLVAAGLIAFITSFEELTIAMFTTGGLSSTLPKKLWENMVTSVGPSLAAVSTLLIAFVALLVVATQLLRIRNDRPMTPAK